ncbi:ANTAR domain-containing protein [Streptomyces mutabilis]|uniref:ANTAR domain-containing protein n=1 Tax=Streptomyces TaxID=1883 RepID=UPI0025B29C14|nr:MULTISPECIES: ANTAR domain-containing protein [unclassified Streptomyces]MDN3250413.1 ANTAR domain-containing protein [Streptomyces sp. ZSW22]MDN3254379.1 ANTAR domain-containing protein [Streptomyces sp. MA25(2023)]
MTLNRPADNAEDQPGPRPDAELERLRTEVTQLRQALASRPVIDQARGMIMAIGRCTPEQAWDVLVVVSQHNNVKLHTVARQLVDTTAGHRLPPPIRRALGQILRARHGTRPP